VNDVSLARSCQTRQLSCEACVLYATRSSCLNDLTHLGSHLVIETSHAVTTSIHQFTISTSARQLPWPRYHNAGLLNGESHPIKAPIPDTLPQHHPYVRGQQLQKIRRHSSSITQSQRRPPTNNNQHLHKPLQTPRMGMPRYAGYASPIRMKTHPPHRHGEIRAPAH
jgi:hypothetical protein